MPKDIDREILRKMAGQYLSMSDEGQEHAIWFECQLEARQAGTILPDPDVEAAMMAFCQATTFEQKKAAAMRLDVLWRRTECHRGA
jgi:hypothetical protein